MSKYFELYESPGDFFKSYWIVWERKTNVVQKRMEADFEHFFFWKTSRIN